MRNNERESEREGKWGMGGREGKRVSEREGKWRESKGKMNERETEGERGGGERVKGRKHGESEMEGK